MNMTIFRDVMDKIRMPESCEAAIIETVDKIESKQGNKAEKSFEQKPKQAACGKDEY